MDDEMNEIGYLRIENKDDREKIASVLFRNGYTVSTVRRKRNGRSYEYYVKYEMRSKEMEEAECGSNLLFRESPLEKQGQG